MKIIITTLIMVFLVYAENLEVKDDLKKPLQFNSDTITEFKGLKTPKSVILIIADGTGIGQYTLSYYANNNFAPSRFDHIGLVATHPDDGIKKVTDSASSGTAMATGVTASRAVDREQHT